MYIYIYIYIYKAFSISIFEFCTLYSNILSHKLKSVMGITKYGAIWTNNQKRIPNSLSLFPNSVSFPLSP